MKKNSFPLADNKLLQTAESDRLLDENSLCSFITNEVEKSLEAYRAQPNLITEHANQEQDIIRGGYAERQLFELVQNGADALAQKVGGGKIVIRLTDEHLYCADDGEPINREGLIALMFSHLSPKRGTKKIGRFGLGFKSLLGISDSPEFFSKSVSFKFDRKIAEETFRSIAPDPERFPVLRTPSCIDLASIPMDKVLQDFTEWASNVIRLPLLPSASDLVAKQIFQFPAEFLLFAKHVRMLELENSLSLTIKQYELEESDGHYWLQDEKSITQWKLSEREHTLSQNARDDRRALDEDESVLIQWAVPVDRLQDTGRFWAFFPTANSSLVAGILNAPWKTNEDRQNLLKGPYNEELILAAVDLVSTHLHELSVSKDPGRHLDALPRRHEAGDSDQVDLLRYHVLSKLSNKNIVPNQEGELRLLDEIRYPPKEITQDRKMNWECLGKWSSFENRPVDWLHNKANTRHRISAIDRMFEHNQSSIGSRRSSIREWLESLVNDTDLQFRIEASKTAIQTAVLIPEEFRNSPSNLGKFVLTATEDCRSPDPNTLFLPEEIQSDQNLLLELSSYVHPSLVSDDEIVSALKLLGISPPSRINQLEVIVDQLLLNGWESETLQKFWILSRKLSVKEVASTVESRSTTSQFKNRYSFPDKQKIRKLICENFRVLTKSGIWKPRSLVLLPGEIVPGDGSRDDSNTADMEFHEKDAELLNYFGFVATPSKDHDVSDESWFVKYQSEHRRKFKKRKLNRTPQDGYLKFTHTSCSGPLEVLEHLSNEGQANYTHALLQMSSTYQNWTMKHTTQDGYPNLECDSPATRIIRNYGRIKTSKGSVRFSDALGPHPKNPDALRILLNHPQVNNIRKFFQLAEPNPEFIGEEESVPLTDVWPGFRDELAPENKNCQLIRCEYILVLDEQKECLLHESNVYLVPVGEELDDLRLVVEALALDLSDRQLNEILEFRTKKDIEEKRRKVKECSTDAERLLMCVGEENLRSLLPELLIGVLESDGARLSGIELAETVIATFHTDALKQCKDSLGHLEPPSRWNGSTYAIDFVESLGFSAEWAGERLKKRDPYVEVSGPSPLPPLHKYQRVVVENVKELLKNGEHSRRGMISLPTGSGKTRVAVQAAVEAIRDGTLASGVLWVADRDEICEQAVEAWSQVWSNEGIRGTRLRISRVWGGQREPLRHGDYHVVVATVQTLNSKLNNSRSSKNYEFLKNFNLVVFDEAHRSIAPTSTTVLNELGLTRFKREDESFLIGLTATPYRGHSEEETHRLVQRYGSTRLDRNAFSSNDPEIVMKDLQSMKILAEVDHEEIEGETITEDMFSDDDWNSLAEKFTNQPDLPWLPQFIEDRIAESVERTNRIVSKYMEVIDPEWPTLIFATSVEHSKAIAALLNKKGIVSRSVSAKDTHSSTRRKIVEDFRSGKIRAIVNYGIFAEGFDAPNTRAIIVARPVYSPNLYFQMIGRGLRGVKNGGNDRCLILNVKDNVESFRRELAFTELEWLWSN